MLNTFVLSFIETIKKQIKRRDFKNNTVLEIIVISIILFLMFSGIITLILGFVYLIYYAITWVAFWLFGPVIFGYTMTWKTPIMIWFIVLVLRAIFNKGK